MRISPPSVCASILFVLALVASGPLDAGVVYVALGDSNTFGNDESTPSANLPNNGDQGYVTHFADFLGSLNGGIRPTVTNLAIPGELSSSFLSGVAPSDWTARSPQSNTNYPSTMISQNTAMIATLNAARAAGSTIDVTLNIGINDFHYLTASTAFQLASAAQQQALFLNLVNQVAANTQTILTEILTYAPGAHIFLPGFYDDVLPGDPTYPLYEMATMLANQKLQQAAPAFGATYVDFYSVIHGNVASYVNATGAHHLNQAGYSAVALALDAAAVPEPASIVLLGLGMTGLLVAVRGCKI